MLKKLVSSLLIFMLVFSNFAFANTEISGSSPEISDSSPEISGSSPEISDKTVEGFKKYLLENHEKNLKEHYEKKLELKLAEVEKRSGEKGDIKVNRKVIVNKLDDFNTIRKSFEEPQLVYQEELIITEQKKDKSEKSTTDEPTISIRASYPNTFIEKRSGSSTYAYYGTTVTVSLENTAELVDLKPYKESGYLAKLKSVKHFTSTTKAPAEYWPEVNAYKHSYDGGYCNKYDFYHAQAAIFPYTSAYNNESNNYKDTGTKYLSFYKSQDGNTHYYSPGYVHIINNIPTGGYCQATGDYYLSFYKDGNSSTLKSIKASITNIGWGQPLSK